MVQQWVKNSVRPEVGIKVSILALGPWSSWFDLSQLIPDITQTQKHILKTHSNSNNFKLFLLDSSLLAKQKINATKY